MPLTSAATLVSVNIRDVDIATRVTLFHDHKKVSNITRSGSKVVTEEI